MGIFHGVVISQLMLYGIEDEPALLPALQQGASLVQIALVSSVLGDVA